MSIAMLAKVTVQKFSCGGLECEDPLDNLLIAWDCMKAYYKANAIPYRFRYMNKLTMFGRTKGFPTGHSFKQSSSKHKTINIKFL